MKKALFLLIVLLCFNGKAQNEKNSPWHIVADAIDPKDYYGITVANGVVGMVSSPDPLKIKDVVLNGVYDYYQRGRVSNILKTFNHMNMHLEVDKRRIDRRQIKGYAQTLDMKNAALITRFEVPKKVAVTHQLFALRNLPYTSMSIIEITAKDDVEIVPINYIETPNHISDVRNLYAEIDRPHVLIPLMSSVGLVLERKKLPLRRRLFSPKSTGMNPKSSMRTGTTTCT